MSRPNLLTLDTWRRHENAVLEVFRCALFCLQGEARPPERENDLNRKLLCHARKENYRLTEEGRGCPSNIYYECANQPAVDDECRAARESKRPDFTCGLVDAEAKLDLFFVLECKRLGRPSSPTWILNENYIKRGVLRFIDRDWGYGEGATSGAMIGYVQTVPPSQALKEVNAYAARACVPAIQRRDAKQSERPVTRLTQRLVRDVSPSPFKLAHLWVDLRHHYLQVG